MSRYVALVLRFCVSLSAVIVSYLVTLLLYVAALAALTLIIAFGVVVSNRVTGGNVVIGIVVAFAILLSSIPFLRWLVQFADTGVLMLWIENSKLRRRKTGSSNNLQLDRVKDVHG